MDGGAFDPKRLQSAPVESLRPMSASPSGDETTGSGRRSSFGFQPHLPLAAAGSRRTSSVDAAAVTGGASKFGFQKRPGHTRSASTEPTWHREENETRPKSNFGYQSQQHNAPHRGASPTGGTELSGSKPRSSFGYQPQQLKRVGKTCDSGLEVGKGRDEVVRRKNFGDQPRRQAVAPCSGDTDMKIEMDLAKRSSNIIGQKGERGAPDEAPNCQVSDVEGNETETRCEKLPQLRLKQREAPAAVLQAAGRQDLAVSETVELPEKCSQEDGTPLVCDQQMTDEGQALDGSQHSLSGSTEGSVVVQSEDATLTDVVDDQGEKALGDGDADFVKYEYIIPRAEEVGIKHPCMADQPAQPPGVLAVTSTQHSDRSLKGVDDLLPGTPARYLPRSPESQVALQYADELLASTPKSVAPEQPQEAVPMATSVEESSSDEEAGAPQGEFPFAYMSGFNTNWMGSGSESDSEQTGVHAMKAGKNNQADSAADSHDRCSTIHVKEGKEKCRGDDMDMDSSSDDYVLEETDVVLQNLMNDQNAPRTPSVEEGHRGFLQASNMSARSTLTGSPSIDSQREEAAVLLQKLMTRSSMTSRSAEEDVNSPYDKRAAARMSLLSRSSGRSGGWDEPIGANEEGDEGSSDGSGMESALQKLMVSVHRMNEEVRDGSTAEKTVSCWLQEDKLPVAAKSEVTNGVADANLKGVEGTTTPVVLDGSVQGTLEELKSHCAGQPVILSEPSCSCSEDTSTMDDAGRRSPMSSVGCAAREGVEHKSCSTAPDGMVDQVGGHGDLQEISFDAEDPVEPAGVDAPTGKKQDVSAVAIPIQFEPEDIGCDVVLVTARDIVDASIPSAACDDPHASGPWLDRASSGLGSVSETSEILSTDSGREASPRPMDILPRRSSSDLSSVSEVLDDLNMDGDHEGRPQRLDVPPHVATQGSPVVPADGSENAIDQEKPHIPMDGQPVAASRAASEILRKDGDHGASPHPVDIPLCAATGVTSAVWNEKNGDENGRECLPSSVDVQATAVTGVVPEIVDEDAKDEGSNGGDDDRECLPSSEDAQATAVTGVVPGIVDEDTKDEGSNGIDDGRESSPSPMDVQATAVAGLVREIVDEDTKDEGSDADGDDKECVPSPIDVQATAVTGAVPEIVDEEEAKDEASQCPANRSPWVVPSEGSGTGSTRERSPSPVDVHTTEVASEENDREASPPPMDVPPYVATKGLSAIFTRNSSDDSDHEESQAAMDGQLTVMSEIAPEVTNEDSESVTNPLFQTGHLVVQQPGRVEESEGSSEPWTPDNAQPVRRRGIDLPLQFDKEWTAASCLATEPCRSPGSPETSNTGLMRARYRGFSCDGAATLFHDEEDYVLARAAAASRMSIDFVDVAMHCPRTSFSTFSFAASADPAIHRRLPCTRLMRRRMDLVMRMQEQWHFGRRPVEGRQYKLDAQDSTNWTQPVLKVLSSPIRGISHIGTGIVSKIASVFGFRKERQ